MPPPSPATNVVSPWWNKLEYEVSFQNDGIHIDLRKEETVEPELNWLVTEVSKLAGDQPALAELITEASKRAALADGSASLVVPRPAQSLKDSSIAKELSAFVFKGHTISISRRRETEFSFFTRQGNWGDWAFEGPGFWAEPGHEYVGTFNTPQIVEDGKRVTVRFYPNGPASWFKYNLKMSASAWQNGTYQGHVIIIIDPVMETTKL